MEDGKIKKGICRESAVFRVTLLSAAGLLLNAVLPALVRFFNVPLFLDNVGSILVAALGGVIPGIVVGFISNIINSYMDPITIYYGILTIVMAWLAAELSGRGVFRKLKGCLMTGFLFSLIGGAVGSCMTWMLYGGGIGEGISAPFAHFFFEQLGWQEFVAQFTADMLIDVPDKLITMLIIFGVLHFYPKRLYDCFPYSYLYDRDAEAILEKQKEERKHYSRRSVNTRIIYLVVLLAVLISGAAIFLGVWYFQKNLRDQYAASAAGAARLAVQEVDGDRIGEYLEKGAEAEGYRDTEEKLRTIKNSLDGISYLYVYQIRDDGMYVVFDIDDLSEEADVPGEALAMDEGLMPFESQLMNGEQIEPFLTNDEFGWLLTAAVPVKDSAGETTAYAFADISMEQYIQEILVYISRIMAMLFCVTIGVCAGILRYVRRRIVEPINSIMELSNDFDHADPASWLSNEKWLNRKDVNTGDEIEKLYRTVCAVEENVANNVRKMVETERQLREQQQLEEKNRELAVAAKRADEANAAKTEFYSRMSHDMRTPMNGILGLVKLSEEETDMNVLHENIRKIGGASEYLLCLINDTLDMSKIESQKMTLSYAPVYVRDFLEEIRDMISPTVAQKDITFKIENSNAKTDVYLMMDEVRIRQIFTNLTSNAVKFTPKGGIITFGMEVMSVEGRIVHDRFIIRDTGVGMSEEFIKNEIFKPFSQEENSMSGQYAGSGLGLAIVKNLVELMNGRIEVESSLGEGTAFTVYLDFEQVEAEEAKKDSQEKSEQEAAQLLKGRRVLLCEDNDLNTEIATRLLEKMEMQVVHAANGKEAAEFFEKSGLYEYDAVLMDIRMPVMNGYEAAEAIRALDRKDAQQVPIIAMTANAYADDIRESIKVGMNEHLAKPIDPLTLYRTLAEWIEINEENGGWGIPDRERS